jgi:hypothetical protein
VVSRIALGLAALVGSVILGGGPALWSVDIHRDVTVASGNVCPVTSANPGGECYARAPAGGWPFPFLYEDPAMSPRGTLSWMTDDFRPGWFLLDAAILGALPILGVAAFRLRRRRSSASPAMR